MTDKITLTNLVNLQNETTAVNAINNNSAAITAAFNDCLSLSGTAPNQMQSLLDMNNNQIINLPNPATADSPARLQDLSTLNGGGTVTNIPTGGTSGQLLAKTSNSNYVVGWIDSSVDLQAGTNISITGTTPVTIKTINNPVFSTSVTTPELINTGTLLLPTSSDTLVGRATTDTLTNKTLTSPVISTISNSGALTLPTGPDTLVGRASTDTLTNKTLTNSVLTTPTINGSSSGTGVSVSANANTLAIRDINGSSNLNNVFLGYTTTASASATLIAASTYQQVFTGSTAQTVVLPVTSTLSLGFAFFIQNNITANLTVQSSGGNTIVILPGGTSAEFICILTSGTSAASWTYVSMHQAGQVIATATNDNANPGNISEYIESVIVPGSAVSLSTTGVSNLTSISLTPGDWDVDMTAYFQPGATTSITQLNAGFSLTTATRDTTSGRINLYNVAASVPNGIVSLNVPPYRFSLSSTTTIFAIARGDFTISTLTVYGIIRARRVR